MPKEQDKILNSLEEALASLKQTTLTGPDFKAIDVLCREWLLLRGYSVKEPYAVSSSAKNLYHLVDLFYRCFSKHYPEMTVPYNNEKRDLKIAKDFVNSRMQAEGMNKAKAIEQTAQIIEALFRYKSHFDFDPVPTFGIFTPSMGWLIDKVIILMNKNKIKMAQDKLESTVEAQTKLIEKSFEPHQELNEILGRNNG